jgi:hypothetical protein
MHQMHISTNHVSSVMLRSKKLEIKKKSENWERADKNQTECHEIEPDLLFKHFYQIIMHTIA